MKLEFVTAKNGELSAKYAETFLHSSYAPSKEAQRIIDSLELPYTPKIVVFTEPCLAYLNTAFKSRFPNIKTLCIRYIKGFDKFNSGFDYVINYFEHEKDFELYLEKNFDELTLMSIFLIDWKPSSIVFAQTDQNVKLALKTVINNAKTILVTRQYFEKKWLINSCNFVRYVTKQVSLIGTIQKPVLLVSSGPSLKPCLELIKQHSKSFFILALSSSLSVLLQNHIIPDLVMSTDGGFWAGEHLKKIRQYELPLALPAEAFCQKSLLQKCSIFPLCYSDGMSSVLLKHTAFDFIEIERNGTVSGSALQFALQYCLKDIYLCGLDMSNQKGFQHAQPNEIECNNSLKDFRLFSKEKRSAGAEFNKGVLGLYARWFENAEMNGRTVYRIIDKTYKKNSLGQIIDISSADFKKKIQNLSSNKNSEKKLFVEKTINNDFNKLLPVIDQISKTEEWKKTIFPLDTVSLSHNPQNMELAQKIEERNNNLLKKLRKILDD